MYDEDQLNDDELDSSLDDDGLVTVTEETNDVRTMMTDLTEAINVANQAYFLTNTPLVDDATYDEIVNQLRTLEQEYPHLRSANSPFAKVEHKIGDPKLLVKHSPQFREPQSEQLDGLMNTEKLDKFLTFVKSTHEGLTGLGGTQLPLLHISHYYKSVPITLVYRDGFLERAISRGDGQSGSDLTHTVASIINVPLQLNAFETEPYPDRLVVRGHVLMPSKTYKQFMTDMVSTGQHYDDSIRVINKILFQENNELIVKYPLTFLAREVLAIEPSTIEDSFTSHTSYVEYMEMLGFQCPPTRIVECDHNNVMDNIRDIYTQRSSFQYPLLGVSVRVDDIHLQKQMQALAQVPTVAWEIKLIYPIKRLIGKIKDVHWKVEDDDNVVPYITIIDVSNNLEHITRLSNLNELLRHHLCIGDMVDVLVRGAHDLIEITHVITHSNCNPLTITDDCPHCGSRLVQRDKNIVCMNQLCSVKLRNIIRRYISTNDKESSGLPLELRDLISQSFVMPHPINLFTTKGIQNLLNQLTVELSKRPDLTASPEITASQFMTYVIPHPTLNLSELLCVLGITDHVNPVFIQEFNIHTIQDLFALTEQDLVAKDLLKTHEVVGILRLIGNPELRSAVSHADIDHPLVKH